LSVDTISTRPHEYDLNEQKETNINGSQ
jgi:hypothetical protein